MSKHQLGRVMVTGDIHRDPEDYVKLFEGSVVLYIIENPVRGDKEYFFWHPDLDEVSEGGQIPLYESEWLHVDGDEKPHITWRRKDERYN